MLKQDADIYIEEKWLGANSKERTALSLAVTVMPHGGKTDPLLAKRKEEKEKKKEEEEEEEEEEDEEEEEEGVFIDPRWNSSRSSANRFVDLSEFRNNKEKRGTKDFLGFIRKFRYEREKLLAAVGASAVAAALVYNNGAG
uniref:Uncharacterized protein n=1 Tax=Vespula pensylvanica TaxID=30213 RepID=A0A834NPY9_VESPE|nr:hypothetical protein H0235_011959 [Vespula pensylvanica]